MDEMLVTQRKYPESVQTGIPRLRSLKTGWKRRKIGELLKEVNRPIAMNDAASYNLVTVKRSRGGVVRRDTKKGREIAVKSQFTVRDGDFLISKRQIVHGACGIVPVELDGAIVSNEYAVLQCTDSLDIRFLDYMSHTAYFQQTCFHSSIGVHIEKMIFKLNDWFRWKIDVPTVVEQQKIAAFLGAVADKIAALRQQHELLQAYKRGMMQRIFSQELRFKAEDGSDYPDWKKGHLKDLISSLDAGVSVNSGDRSAGETEKGILKTSCVSFGNFIPSKNKVVLSNAEILRLRMPIHARTVIISRMNTPALVGANAYVDRDYPSIYLPDRLWAAKIKPEHSSKWVAILLSSKKTRAAFSNRATGTSGSMKNITKEDVLTVPISYPTRPEQQKIADFLSAIDAKIDAVSTQIEKMETFKKGLLQQMFA